MTDHTELDAMIACLGLEYSAEFVPQSQSRNAKEQHPSLNWRVVIKNAGRIMRTDYMQGIGHLPKDSNSGFPIRSVGHASYERSVAEEGKYKTTRGFRVLPLPAPSLRDVLYCLVLDARVIDYASFEEWASEYDYDTDSREAEKTYQECLAVALQLRAVVGNENINRLREAFQDY